MIVCLYIGNQFYFYVKKERCISIPIERKGQLNIAFNKKELVIQGNQFIRIKKKHYGFFESIQLEYTEYYCPFELFVFPYNKEFTHYFKIQIKDCFRIGTQEDCDIQLTQFFKETRLLITRQNQTWQVQDELQSGYLTVNRERVNDFKKEDSFCFEYLSLRIGCFLDCVMINSPVQTELKRYTYRKYGKVQVPYQLENYPLYEIKKSIEPVVLKVEEWIPCKQENSHFSFSSMIMAMSTLTVALISFYKGMENQQNWIYQISGLIFPSSMLLSSVLIPFIHLKKADAKRKKQIQKRNDYLDKKIEELRNEVNFIKKEKLKAQQERYPKNMDFSLLLNQRLLFSRVPQQFDFLYLPIGIGKIDSLIQIEIPKERQAEEDYLEYLKKCEQLKCEASVINEAYIECDLKKIQLFSILVHEKMKVKVACEVLSELILLHDPNNLSLAIYCEDEGFPIQDFLSFSHFFSSSLKHRFIFHNVNDLLTLHPFLMESLEKKFLLFLFYDLKDFHSLHPDILKHKHFCAIQVVDKMDKIFFDAKMILDLRQRGNLYDIRMKKHTYFSSFYLSSNGYDTVKQLSGRLALTHKNKSSFGLIHCFQEDIFQKGWIKKQWKEVKFHSLKAILGQDYDGNRIELDLHESKDGPHGLIAGATGSGKTDLILTLMLSLSLNYSFNELQFVVLDYKGGNGILPLCKEGKRLPHLGAFISNLSNYEIERSLFMLKDECRQRQQLFVKISEEYQVTIANMDSYQAMKSKYHFPELPALVVIVDEFAELKKEMPNYLQELISMARVGRSLGIHLILATQKPSGIIDEQILSNIHFRICLKVQSKQESQEMIQSHDAYYFTSPGQFALLTPRQNKTGKAAWVNRIQEVSNRLELLDDAHRVIKKIESNESDEKEIDVLLDLIHDATKEERDYYKLWNDYPEKKEMSEWFSILDKHIFGLVDDLENRRINPLELNPAYAENIFIYGQEMNQVQDCMMTIFKTNLYQQRKQIVLALVKSKYSYQEMDSWISCKILLEEENRIKKLIYHLNKIDNPILLLIEDFLSLQNFLDSRILLKLLSNNHVYCYASCFSLNGIRSYYLEAFDFIIALEELSKNEQYLLFNQSYQYGTAPSLIKMKTLYSFVPAYFDLKDNPLCLTIPYTDHKTEYLCLDDYCYTGLPIGVDEEENCIELSNHKAVLITGLYEESLTLFKNHLIKNNAINKVILDESEQLKKLQLMDKKEEWIRKNKPIFFVSYSKWKQYGIRYDFEEVVWLGNGISFQTMILLSSDLYTLKDNEGVYSYNARVKKIRLFDG